MKKRIKFISFICICVLLFAGCGGSSRTVHKMSFSDLDNWMCENGFDDSLSQIKLREFAESLLYQGQAVKYKTGNWDGEGGGGCDGENEDGTSGYSDVYWREPGSTVAKYECSFYTEINFDNFSLPGKVKIGDSFAFVMQTLMMQDCDPVGAFTADADDENSMTLKKEGNARVLYTKITDPNALQNRNYISYLAYEVAADANEGEDEMTRQIRFYFTEDKALAKVEIVVSQKLYRN